MTEAHILIVDDNPGVLSAGKLFLKRHFAVVETAKDPEAIPQILQDQRYDVILLDMNFNRNKNTGQEGLLWLDRILDIDPTAVVVLITAYGDVDLAVRAIKKGATDFVLKPWDNEKLLATLTSALRLKNSKDENTQLKSRQMGRNLAEVRDLPPIIFRSKAMQAVLDTI
ncbi:MAG: response regulator, partial [Saprospiraceae bacterium]